jgi:hypothetical protein
MFHFRRVNLRLLVVLAIIAIMATAAYGFAASNTVPTSRAGDGSGAISGYKVSNVHYTMDQNNPTNITEVDFDLNHTANTVQVRLVSNGGWFTCDPVTAAPDMSWTCTISGVTVAAANSLEVAAAD